MKPDETDYQERLLYITRNLVEYGNYDKDITKAAKVVRKYFKEKSLDECTNSLRTFVDAYYYAVGFVEANKNEYRQDMKEIQPDLAKKEKAFFEKYPDISEKLIKSLIYWIFYWYHER